MLYVVGLILLAIAWLYHPFYSFTPFLTYSLAHPRDASALVLAFAFGWFMSCCVVVYSCPVSWGVDPVWVRVLSLMGGISVLVC